MRRFFKKNKIQIFKFGLVGLASTLLNFCVYSIIYNLTFRLEIASLIGYVAGLFNSFYFSDNWVFTKSRTKRINYAIFLFVIIYFIGGIAMALTVNIVDNLIQNHKLAWICGIFVAAINNYFCSKYFLFND